MFHSQINGTIVTFMEKSTFKAHVDFHGSVPLITENFEVYHCQFTDLNECFIIYFINMQSHGVELDVSALPMCKFGKTICVHMTCLKTGRSLFRVSV